MTPELLAACLRALDAGDADATPTSQGASDGAPAATDEPVDATATEPGSAAADTAAAQAFAVDIDGDLAAVSVASLLASDEPLPPITLFFHRSGSTWAPLHGDDGQSVDLRVPPAMSPFHGWYSVASWGYAFDPTGGTKGDAGYVHHVVFKTAPQVATITVRGQRREVADHGYVCVVWRSGEAPLVAFMSAGAEQLDAVRCPEPPRSSLPDPSATPPADAPAVEVRALGPIAPRGLTYTMTRRRSGTRPLLVIGGVLLAACIGAGGVILLRPAQPAELRGPGVGETVTGPTPCPAADGSSPRTTRFEQPPPVCIVPGNGYSAVINTTKGTFRAELDAARAPTTVNNFVVLARYHFYDGIPFHRILRGFVIQVGDPSPVPDGEGDPGYEIAEEPPADGIYERYDLVMANKYAAGTTGSQFLVITGDPGRLNASPTYSLFGSVVDGTDVVDEIAAVETGGPKVDAPMEVVRIRSITIEESQAGPAN